MREITAEDPSYRGTKCDELLKVCLGEDQRETNTGWLSLELLFFFFVFFPVNDFRESQRLFPLTLGLSLLFHVMCDRLHRLPPLCVQTFTCCLASCILYILLHLYLKHRTCQTWRQNTTILNHFNNATVIISEEDVCVLRGLVV